MNIVPGEVILTVEGYTDELLIVELSVYQQNQLIEFVKDMNEREKLTTVAGNVYVKG